MRSITRKPSGLAVFGGEELLRSLLWFHPCVWWLLGRIQLCREQVVDADTIALTEDREVYLETLIAFAERVANFSRSSVSICEAQTWQPWMTPLPRL